MTRAPSPTISVMFNDSSILVPLLVVVERGEGAKSRGWDIALKIIADQLLYRQVSMFYLPMKLKTFSSMAVKIFCGVPPKVERLIGKWWAVQGHCVISCLFQGEVTYESIFPGTRFFHPASTPPESFICLHHQTIISSPIVRLTSWLIPILVVTLASVQPFPTLLVWCPFPSQPHFHPTTSATYCHFDELKVLLMRYWSVAGGFQNYLYQGTRLKHTFKGADSADSALQSPQNWAGLQPFLRRR